MPYVDVSGTKLYFEDHGVGYAVIFVHEFGSDLRQWEDQVRYFSRAYRCIAYNARGYPPSDVPTDAAAYGWERSVGDIAALMDALDIQRAHIVGLSMGAYGALQFGLRYPHRATAIVSAAAGSGSSPSHRHAWLRETSVLARAFAERGAAAMAGQVAKSGTRIQLKYKDPKRWQEFADQLREQSGPGLSNTIIRCQAQRPSLHELREEFSKMAVPVLLMVGDEDVACLETNLMLKATLPNAGLFISPNTGHAINLEEPAAFNAQVETFLAAVERRSWRRFYTTPALGTSRVSLEQNGQTRAPLHTGDERSDSNVVILHQANRPADVSPSELPRQVPVRRSPELISAPQIGPVCAFAIE
ncbi:alpha/beta hydrolase [Bradyrhizobium sp. dw_78]|uniref:alpha/beta fold hydrolase n=1 Tax=Bradyrhizobium sp. dw_78 TaxID=2719793 RepID=UPI001BD53C3A|nr:alpha/beta hydrolase [Bradyrhizobium sp. dw_78]